MGSAVADHLEPLGLQSVGAQGAEELAEPFRRVDQGKAAPVSQAPRPGVAHLGQSAVLLASPLPPRRARPGGIVGGITDHQIAASRWGQILPPAQVSGRYPAAHAAQRPIFGGQRRRPGGELQPKKVHRPLPPEEEQAEKAAAAAQITHPIPPAHRGKFPQGQTVSSQGEAVLLPSVEEGAQPLLPHERLA